MCSTSHEMPRRARYLSWDLPLKDTAYYSYFVQKNGRCFPASLIILLIFPSSISPSSSACCRYPDVLPSLLFLFFVCASFVASLVFVIRVTICPGRCSFQMHVFFWFVDWFIDSLTHLFIHSTNNCSFFPLSKSLDVSIRLFVHSFDLLLFPSPPPLKFCPAVLLLIFFLKLGCEGTGHFDIGDMAFDTTFDHDYAVEQVTTQEV